MKLLNVKLMNDQPNVILGNEMENQKSLYESIWELRPTREDSKKLLTEIGKINSNLKPFRVREATAILNNSLVADFGPNLSDYQLSSFNECQSAVLEMLS